MYKFQQGHNGSDLETVAVRRGVTVSPLVLKDDQAETEVEKLESLLRCLSSDDGSILSESLEHEPLTESLIYKLMTAYNAGETEIHNTDVSLDYIADGSYYLLNYGSRRFKISPQKRELGHGSFSTVYLCHVSEVVQRAVSLSLALKQCCHESREARLHEISKHRLFCFNSPYIVQFYGEFVVQQAFLMEYCGGGNLQDFICAHPIVSAVDEASYCESLLEKIIIPLTRALLILQTVERPVVHLDLTLKNILLDDNGYAKVADFGCARTLESLKKRGHIESGTFSIKPPEAVDKDLVNAQAEDYFKLDVWAVGLMIKQLLGMPLPLTQVPRSISIFDRQAEVASWAESYSQHYMRMLNEVLSGHTELFGKLNALANLLLAPAEDRPIAAELHASFDKMDWHKSVDKICKKMQRKSLSSCLPIMQHDPPVKFI